MNSTKKLCTLILIVFYVHSLSCPTSQQATASNLHYPSWTGYDCPLATDHAESQLTSYHYRKACQNTLNLPSLPSQVYEAEVIDCLNANINPTTGWSSGVVVNVTVCCEPLCEQVWTNWLNRVSPSGSGDYETLNSFSPTQVCD